MKHRKLLIVILFVLPLVLSACGSIRKFVCEEIQGGTFWDDYDSKEPVCIPGESGAVQEANQPQDPAGDEPASNSSCVPVPADYALDFTNLNDKNNATKRSCNARGQIKNTGKKPLMFAVYRVNHYGAEETFGEKWMWNGIYQTLEPGKSTEYGRFHRCVGGNCGEGEWFYIKQVSLLYSTPECIELKLQQEEILPASIIPIKDPCSW